MCSLPEVNEMRPKSHKNDVFCTASEWNALKHIKAVLFTQSEWSEGLVALCISVRMFDPQNHSLNLDSTDSTQNILDESDFGFHPSNKRTALHTGQIAMKITLKRLVYYMIQIIILNMYEYLLISPVELLTLLLCISEAPVDQFSWLFEVFLSPSRKM
jgi:hypothetical protein